MQFLGYLYTLIIGPLELLFGIIFSILNRHIGNAGISVIFLSLVFSLMVLPLYRRADRIQDEAREREAKLGPVITHIKKVFKGDERFMMLQTYYRENNYSPLSVLRSSVSLLLQIPFFLAAYSMLSDNRFLQGMSFGPIADLGKPDTLIAAGTFAINLLPILMTLINVISSVIYTSKLPLKDKVQPFILAALFLILLYNSPSGLVLYWTCNNIFALIKNIVIKKLPAPAKQPRVKKSLMRTYKNLFILSGICAGLYEGFYLPATVIGGAPQEFIALYEVANPAVYLVTPALLGLGLFAFWPFIFFSISSDKGKKTWTFAMFMLTCMCIVNSQFFGKNLGTMSNLLVYDVAPSFEVTEIIISLIASIGVCALCYLMVRFAADAAKIIVAIAPALFVILGGVCIFTVSDNYTEFVSNCISEPPHYTLSTEGTNVVVIMLDRSMGPMLPYIFQENPELEEQFDGFTYYPNTISYGTNTNFAAPALYGGYEYTPMALNARSDELLSDKNDEALKVLPVLFADNGFDSTTINPPYAGYYWYPNLNVFEDCEGVNAYNTLGSYLPSDFDAMYGENLSRSLFCFSICKSMPLLVHNELYDNGLYNRTVTEAAPMQIVLDENTSMGRDTDFEMEYYTLLNMDKMITVEQGTSNNFMIMDNKAAHNVALLQTPDYVPADYVDNTDFNLQNTARFTYGGVTMNIDDGLDYMEYETNTAALKAIGLWLDYLREQGVYDNTRIIIVADHGLGLGHFDGLLENDQGVEFDAEGTAPLLLVKDFGAEGFTVSDEFMTNADTPYLATNGIIDDPVNPFTGNPISDEGKNGRQMIFCSEQWSIYYNNGSTFIPDNWYSVEGDIWNKDNWQYEGYW